jgi:hypothetical protein
MTTTSPARLAGHLLVKAQGLGTVFGVSSDTKCQFDGAVLCSGSGDAFKVLGRLV